MCKRARVEEEEEAAAPHLQKIAETKKHFQQCRVLTIMTRFQWREGEKKNAATESASLHKGYMGDNRASADASLRQSPLSRSGTTFTQEQDTPLVQPKKDSTKSLPTYPRSHDLPGAGWPLWLHKLPCLDVAETSSSMEAASWRAKFRTLEPYQP